MIVKLKTFVFPFQHAKGQLIWKANCQAVKSFKKQMNEFAFTTIRRVFLGFLEDIKDNRKDEYFSTISV